jgi:hypothetical protein
MNNFKLVNRLVIRDVKLNIKPDNNCYLYHFKEAGLSIKQLINWLNGKILDVYEFTGRFGSSKKCPWCGSYDFDDFEEHIKEHGKTIDNLHTNKLAQKTYPLLLEYNRNDHYDALGFYVNATCQDCIAPVSPDRQGKCEIPEATRSRMRSLKTMGFECNNFNIVNYSNLAVCFIYKRKPIK